MMYAQRLSWSDSTIVPVTPAVRPVAATGDLTVQQVRGRGDLRAFVGFARRLHGDDPGFVPPLEFQLRRKLSSRTPLFRDADLVPFLARQGAEVVGTVSVLRDRRHEQHTGERVSFFGFFECVDDTAVARALLDRAEVQSRAWGATSLRGPRNLSRVEAVGVLVDGFDTRPPFMGGHTPGYYRRLLEELGFAEHHDVLAYDIDLLDADGRHVPIPDKLQEQADAVDIPSLQLRPTRWRTLGRDLRLAHAVFVEAFRDVPDNTPMPLRQFLYLGRLLIALTHTSMLQLATIDGKAAGFALCFPEVNEAIVHARGRLFPLGWLRLLLNLRRIRTASFKLIGVLPEYRRSGLHALMIRRAVEGCREAGYRRLEASLVDARNHKIRKVIEPAGMQVYRRYRVYERAL
jgi:GNAT superfamily N-acetyltransferase